MRQSRNQTKETEEKEQFDRKERKKHKVEITDIRNLRSLRGSVPNSSSARFAILDPPSSILNPRSMFWLRLCRSGIFAVLSFLRYCLRARGFL
jgi:hypothetical protein